MLRPTRVHIYYGPLCLSACRGTVLHQVHGFASLSAAKAAWLAHVSAAKLHHVTPSFHERSVGGAFIRVLAPPPHTCHTDTFTR